MLCILLLAFHFSLLLHWNHFFQNIFLFLGRVPTVAYLMAQYTSYNHQMTLYGESAKTKAGIISKGFLVGVQMRRVWFLFNNSNFYLKKNNKYHRHRLIPFINCTNFIYIVEDHFIFSRITCLKVFMQSYIQSIINKNTKGKKSIWWIKIILSYDHLTMTWF